MLTRSYDNNHLSVLINENLPKLVRDQRQAFDSIIDSVQNNKGKIFFVDAPGATWKTFLENLMLAKVRQSGKNGIAVASSGATQ